MRLSYLGKFLNKRKFYYYLSFLLPTLFFVYCLNYFYFYGANYSVDGWSLFNSVRAILDGYGYSGNAAMFWPPIYSLLSALLGLPFGAEIGSFLVTVFSSVGILTIIPFLSNKLTDSFVPGLCCQTVLAFNPIFFSKSLQLENHMLDAFFFLLSVMFAVEFINGDQKSFPWKFFLFGALAFLTRYPSFLVITAFWIFGGYFLKNEQTKIHLIKLALYAFGIIFPWLVYNYFWNHNLPIISGRQYDLIGLSFINNEIFKMPVFAWASLHRFSYDGFFDFLLQHPSEFLLNIFLNVLNVGSYIFYHFPFFGIFSFIMTLGLINLILNSADDRKLFLIVLLLCSLFIFCFVMDKPIYFLKYAVILNILGFQLVADACNQIIMNSLVSPRVVPIGVLLIFAIFQSSLWLGVHQKLWNGEYSFPNYSYRGPNVAKKIQSGLTTLKYRVDNSPDQIKIMNIRYSFQIYHAGFKPIFGLLPKDSPMELFCYSGMTPQRRLFHQSFNFPPRAPVSDFVPPDYLLLDNQFKSYLLFSTLMEFSDLEIYIEPVDWWTEKVSQAKIMLFKVRKEKLNC